MLSLWKLRVGVEEYYLAQVASGLDDYYTGSGEGVGEWTGGGIAGLGLSGEVVPSDLRAVMAGLAPGTALTPNGEQLRARKARVPGFDLTFAVPKSVSVIYGLGDPRVQGAVLDAAGTALDEALAWLERDACFVRRGSNRQAPEQSGATWGTWRMATSGFVAARFPHRTSRAGDPHLHWHVLVANMAQGVDGRWTALDGRALYANKRAAGVLFQSVLRRELTERLGIEWGSLRNDTAEVAGVPGPVLRLFSTRREQIREWLEDHGRSGPAAAANAMAATRPAKTVVPGTDLRAGWVARAVDAGWGPDRLDGLLGTAASRDVGVPGWPVVSEAAFPGWRDELLRSRLTAHDSTFSRGEVLQAVAGSIPGAHVAEVERLAHRILADPELVPVATAAGSIRLPDRDVADTTMLRWTTRELLALEARYIHLVRAGVGAGRAVVSDEKFAAAVASVERLRPGVRLGEDQRGAVTRLASQGHAVEVLVGRAGTGKTTALAALRAAYESAGFEVLGLAPSARAAREIEHEAGIASQTIARFLHHPPPVDSRTVVVVDEAAMSGTRDLAATVDRVLSAGGKVVLVGDDHQLPEISAGGGFTAAVEILGDQACELTVVRRQAEQWERDALDELRHGDVAVAWDAYGAHDRVTLAEDPVRLHRQVVEDWWTHREAGCDVLVVAGTRAEAAGVNRLARDRLQKAGQLSGPALDLGDRAFRVGDRVVLRRNDPHQRDHAGHRASVANGTLADVAGVNPRTGAMAVTIRPTGERVVLDGSYVTASVQHGYALTIHQSQGLTCDVVLVVGPAGLNREAAYVALSRARTSAHLYATADQAAELAERHPDHGIPLPGETSDPEEAVLARFRRSGAKTFASRLDTDALVVAELAAAHPLAELDRLAAVARRAERRCDGPHPDLLAEQARNARETRALLREGRRVHALDRDNIGTVLAVHDNSGTAAIRFVSATGSTAVRTVPWAELQVVDHADPVPLTDLARRTLRQLDRAAEQHAERWRQQLERDGVAPGDAALLARASALAADRSAHDLQADPPTWLTGWLGDRPTAQVGALLWDDVTAKVAVWRARHAIDERVPGLGPEPDDPAGAVGWHELTRELVDTEAWLRQSGTSTPTSPPERPRAELAARRAELKAVLDGAPPDQRHIVDGLIAGRIGSTDLHARLVEASRSQERRNAWILEHWPHIVELEQIDLLLPNRDLIAHWAGIGTPGPRQTTTGPELPGLGP
ncbi:MAG: conjugative relaxase [Actinomycetia bacterium]|nr:conjugative relaxase [Actinomycetes bacterium]